jgi:hypothetical protein
MLLAGGIVAATILFFVLPSYKRADDADRAAELHRALARGEVLSPENANWLAAYDARTL